MTIPTPILQFGTSRFLQAHADLFVSEAMDRGVALGPITVVQTTDRPESGVRVAALASGEGYAVLVRGLRDGDPVEERVTVHSVSRALTTARDWSEIRRIASHEARVILSNTGDLGFVTDPSDRMPEDVEDARPPASFPAKLVALLHGRWRENPDAPLTVLPCELVSGNGTRLRGIVADIARAWALDAAFVTYLDTRIVWGNSLVDRIVSEPLHPVGAIAEPYALWAIERQPGLMPPCRHPHLVLTDDLAPYERRKLHLLNLGHTVLAQHWLASGAPSGWTVLRAMEDEEARALLESVWIEEVLPVFDAVGDGEAARDYVAMVRDRFCNPYLAHRLSDIAENHDQKKARRIGPVLALAREFGLSLPQERLRVMLGGQDAS